MELPKFTERTWYRSGPWSISVRTTGAWDPTVLTTHYRSGSPINGETACRAIIQAAVKTPEMIRLLDRVLQESLDFGSISTSLEQEIKLLLTEAGCTPESLEEHPDG